MLHKPPEPTPPSLRNAVRRTVRVLRDDNTEVEIMETSDYGDVDLRSIIEGDRHSNKEECVTREYGPVERA